MSELLCELLGERLMDRDQAEVECSPLGTDGRLVALYFGCSWSASCKEFTAALADFYSRFKQGENGDKLEVVFISSEEEYKPWKEFVGQMPWLVLPFQDMERKIKLWSKYKVTNVPSLIFIEGSTGRTISRNGHLIIRDDPLGSEFPWGSKSFGEVMAGSLIKNNGQVMDSTALDGSYVGVYFSAHWCPPCRSLTRVLVETYRKIKEMGHKFEIVFVSADRSEDSFKQYFNEMPWLAVPYTDEARRSRLNWNYGIQVIGDLMKISALRYFDCLIQPEKLNSLTFLQRLGTSLISIQSKTCLEDLLAMYTVNNSILSTKVLVDRIPTLLILDQEGKIITRQGRPAVLNDIDCKEFPWHPKPVLELKESNALQLNERPSLVLFVDSEEEELEPAKQLIQPIAEKIFSEHKAKDEDPPLLFFVAGEDMDVTGEASVYCPSLAGLEKVEDDMTESLRDFTNLPESAPLLTILDMSQRAKYVKDVEEITPAIVEEFVKAFLKEKLKPEPI